MGDAVNLASRLEGVTKQYGVGIIIGEGTRELLKDQFLLREIDCIRVKGRNEPLSDLRAAGTDGKATASQQGTVPPGISFSNITGSNAGLQPVRN